MSPEQLRRLAAMKRTDAEKIRAAAGGRNEPLTEDEMNQIRGLCADADRIENQAAELESLLGSKVENSARPNVAPVVEIGAPRIEQDPRRGFATPRAFFAAIIDGARNGKIGDGLKSLASNDGEGSAFCLPTAFVPRSLAAGSDEGRTVSDPAGGYLVPTTFIPSLLEVGFSGDPTAGLTMNIPMASPKVEIPAKVDKDHSSSVSGGFVVYRRSETQAVTASTASFEKISLNADSLAGLTYATEELLQDSPISFAAIIDAGFRSEFAAKILQEKISGTGVGQYLGILNSPAKVTIAKETDQVAATINYTNLAKMVARFWSRGGGLWLYNSDALVQLLTMTNPGGQMIWQPSAREGMPSTILGMPAVACEYCSALGTEGDIALVDWSQYLEGTYQPIQGASSIHVRFVNNESAFRFTMRNAGAPWWRSALTPKNGTTKSPIVTLAVRS